MKRLNPFIAKCKAFFIRNIYFHKCGQAVELHLFPYKIKRRKDVQEKYGKYKNTAAIEYRRSKLPGYEYVSISFFYYIYINIDFHRPV